jgi:hypothetical protein
MTTQFGSGLRGPASAFTHLKFRSGVRSSAGGFSLVFGVSKHNHRLSTYYFYCQLLKTYNIKNKYLFFMSIALNDRHQNTIFSVDRLTRPKKAIFNID